MAAALSAFTFGFRDVNAGWSETWYGPSTYSQSGSLSFCQGYLNLRMKLMGLGISTNYCRYRALDGTGVSYKFNIAQTTTANLTSGAVDSSGRSQNGVFSIYPIYSGNPDVPNSTLMLTLQPTNAPAKRIYLSGIPDAVITDPGGPSFQPGYQEGLNAWIQYIAAAGLGYQTVGGPSANPKYPVLAVSMAGTVTTTAAAYAAGVRVGVYGFRNLKGYRGKFSVISTAGGVITLSGYAPPTNLLNPPKSFVRAIGVNYQPIPATIAGYREATHKRGKGLNQQVGRRKAHSN
jgi:hypothetical protein